MIWQDVLLMVGCFGFSVALIPALIAKQKPPRITCLTTGGILISFCVAYATLGLWMAFAGAALVASTWFILLFQHRVALGPEATPAISRPVGKHADTR